MSAMPEVYIGPLSWNSAEKVWESPHPEITIGGILDFRNEVEATTSGDDPPPPTQGHAIFALSSTVIDPNLDYLGNDLDALTSAQRAAMENKLRLASGTIEATTLREALWECLTEHGDAGWEDAWRPLLPCADRCIDLHLGGFGRIKHQRFDPGSAYSSRVLRKCLHQDYRKIFAAVKAGKLPEDHHRKVLGAWIKKYKIANPSFYIPPGHDVVSPRRPSTSIIDIFDRADQLLSASTVWAHLGPFGDVIKIVSNQLETLNPNTPARMQHQTVLSTDDHTAQLDTITLNVPTASESSIRVSTRMRDLNNEYNFSESNSFTTGKRRKIRKIVAGVGTVLSDVAQVFSLPDTVKGKSGGSSHTISIDGTDFETVTDTSLTGDLNIGLEVNRATGTVQADSQADKFSGGDIVPPTTGGAKLVAGILD